MTTTKASTVIESNTRPLDYNMMGVEAIVDHPAHGRLYITQAFGGIDTLAGGRVRWRHGLAVKLQPGDTLDFLRTERPDSYETYKSQMLAGYDDERPIQPWHGDVVQRIAEDAGLA